MYTVDEQDWKLFRKRLPDWQESYMERLIQKYASLLAESKPASEKFHAIDAMIHKDRNHIGVQARMSRSCMVENILGLLYDGVITKDDLNGFSDDLCRHLLFLTRDYDEPENHINKDSDYD